MPPHMAHLPQELILLGLVLVLAVVQIFLPASMRQKQYGPEWALGARDEAMPPPAPVTARLQRAHANLMETLPLFTAAVLAVVLAGRSGTTSAIGAHMFFWGRLAYLVIYAAGLRGWRTVAFLVASLGLLVVVAALFLG